MSRASAIIVESTNSTACGPKRDQMLGGIHGLIEGREMANAHHLVLGEG